MLLTVASGALLVLGLLMTFSASFVASTAQTGDAFGIFSTQLRWAVLGLPLAVAAAAVDHRLWRRAAVPLLLVSLALSALVLIPGVGVARFGARRCSPSGRSASSRRRR